VHIYLADITYGPTPNMRGHWADRVAGIDADLRDMEKHLTHPIVVPTKPFDPAIVRMAVTVAVSRPRRPSFAPQHMSVARFKPGKPLDLVLSISQTDTRKVTCCTGGPINRRGGVKKR